jgi:hypothetical protein
MTQAVTSAETSVKQVPAILNKIIKVMRMPESFFASVGDVLDVGGGKYDMLTDKFAEMGVRNWVWDPFNRSTDHNSFVERMLTARRADVAICSNVLNVIRERTVREFLHRGVIKKMSNPEGLVFFTVYEGDKTAKGKKTTKGWQANRPAWCYLRGLRKHYDSVTLCSNKLFVCEGFKENT